MRDRCVCARLDNSFAEVFRATSDEDKMQNMCVVLSDIQAVMHRCQLAVGSTKVLLEQALKRQRDRRAGPYSPPLDDSASSSAAGATRLPLQPVPEVTESSPGVEVTGQGKERPPRSKPTAKDSHKHKSRKEGRRTHSTTKEAQSESMSLCTGKGELKAKDEPTSDEAESPIRQP